MAQLEVRRTPDGKVLARRKDGLPLTPEDREEAKRLALSDTEALEVQEAETIQGIKIASSILGDEIWLVLERSFIPHDDLACYYPEEIPLLRHKTPEELREIHKAKLAFPECRVIQEGAEAKGANGE